MEGGLRSNRDREWPGVCCWGGSVADVKSGNGVGGDDTGRGRLARVTLKNDVCPPGRERECAHTGAATIFQTNDVTLVSFARCRRVAVQTLFFVSRIFFEFYRDFIHLFNRSITRIVDYSVSSENKETLDLHVFVLSYNKIRTMK